MFRFQHASNFWWLLLIPLIVIAYVYLLSWKKRNIKKIGDAAAVKSLISGKIDGRTTTKLVLNVLAMLCLVVGLTNLQGGGYPEQSEQKGLDVIFTLDVSNSMLARDLKPDRLTKAKEMIYRCLEQLKNDRTGLVVFAGNAYLQSPLTTDYGAMRMLLASVDPSMMPTQGTNFTDAIELAARSFKKEDKQNKVIILISDGEDHSESAVKAAKELAKEGVIIYTVGIGSPEGSSIYDPTTGRDKTDMEGNVVVSKLNEDILKTIAQMANGRYHLMTNAGQVASSLSKSLQQLESKNLGVVVYTDYKSYFQYFLAVGLLLFLIAWFLPDATSRKVSPTKALMSLAMFLMPLALVSLPNHVFAQDNAHQNQTKKAARPSLDFKKKINKGNSLFNQRLYNDAGEKYAEALKNNPQSFEGNFNAGDALYGAENYEEARKGFQNSLNSAESKLDKAAAYHNIGNSYLKERKWSEAADNFKKALMQNPKDQDTKYNLAYAQRMMQMDNQNNQDNQDEQNKDKDQQQDKKDNQDENNQDNQDKQDQQNQDKEDEKDGDSQDKPEENKEDQKDEKPKPMPSKLSQQQAENILNALNQEEKDLHKKKKEEKGVPVKPDKDW